MRTRVVAAAVLVPLLFLIVLVAPKELAAVVMGVLMAIGSYELLYRTALVRQPRLVIYSSIMAFSVSIWSAMEAVRAYFLLLLILYFLLMFSEIMLDHVKVRAEMLALCFLAGVIIPYMLSALIRILMLSMGRYLILIPFVTAFMSDSGAYFVGIRFGKHKLAPVVSPNKTIEGVLGGFAGAIAGMLVYTVILDWPCRLEVNYLVAMLYGLVGSAAGTFGDLCFSVIKRQTGIKDYGNLIPGHGGVLDRFDSMVLVAPLMEALILVLPIIVV